MENFLLFIFCEIWPKTMYYSTWSLAQFLSKLKIYKKFNFDWNPLKVSIQHKKMYMHQEKNIKIENFLLFIFCEIWPKTM